MRRSRTSPARVRRPERFPGAGVPHLCPWRKRVELEYSQVLPNDAGLVRYVYPLNTEKFSLSPAGERAHHARPIDARAPLKSGLFAEPRRHRDARGRRARQGGLWQRGRTARGRFQPLLLGEREGRGGGSLLYREDPEDGYFLLLVSPGTVASDEQAVAKDVFFVVDTSGSMRGQKLVRAQGATKPCCRT